MKLKLPEVMNENLQIKHTAFPDGTIVSYMYGMPRPQIKNLNSVMKKALENYILEQNQSLAVPVIRLSKAG